MTELLTAAQMRAIETAAISSGEVTGLAVMERAGKEVVEAILRWRPDLAAGVPSASVLCGPGNNGGDGYVIARLLRDRGWMVTLHGLTEPKTPDARHMRGLWTGAVLPLTERAFRDAPEADLYIDAIFGTGLTRAPDGDLACVLRRLEAACGEGEPVPRLVAVDAPSGLCLDSGRSLGGKGAVPQAGLTVTFECPKIGHFIADGPCVCGALDVVDLGLAEWRGADLTQDLGVVRAPKVQLIDRKAWAALCANDSHAPSLNLSKQTGHKFDHGHALIVSGCFARTGAARLAARAALRIGAGLVTLAAPRDAMAECAAQLTAIMLREAEEAADLAALLDDKRITSVCIGPGLGLAQWEADKVAAVLESGKACVLDADALTHLAQSEVLRGKLHENCVLTPHMGEFQRLCPDLAAQLTTKAMLPGPAFSKVDAVTQAAKRLGAVILLKGYDTVIAAPEGQAFVHSASYDRAAPWLATAGAGDVLAGLIAGLLARWPQMPMHHVPTAVWLHAEAARAFGPGLIAEDLPDMLPKVLQGSSITSSNPPA